MQDRRLSGAVSGTLQRRQKFFTECLREDYYVDPRDHRVEIKQDSGHVSNTEKSVVVTESKWKIFRKEVGMAVEMRDCRFGG